MYNLYDIFSGSGSSLRGDWKIIDVISGLGASISHKLLGGGSIVYPWIPSP